MVLLKNLNRKKSRTCNTKNSGTLGARAEKLCHATKNSTLPDKPVNGTLALQKHSQKLVTPNGLSSSITNRNSNRGTQASIEVGCPVTGIENIGSCVPDIKKQNNQKGKVDIYDSKSIIQATIQGNLIVKHINVCEIENKCQDLKKALCQQDTPFGFLPLNDLKYSEVPNMHVPHKTITLEQFDPVVLHETIFNSGKFNFLGEKIQLPTDINLDRFQELQKITGIGSYPFYFVLVFP